MLIILKIKILWEIHDGRVPLLEDFPQDIKILVEVSKDGSQHNLFLPYLKELKESNKI